MENVHLPRAGEENVDDEREDEDDDADDELEDDGAYDELMDEGGGDDDPGEFVIHLMDSSEAGTSVETLSSNMSEISFTRNVSPSTELTNFLLNLSKHIIQSSCIRVISLSLSYPFEVLYIRRCAQYVGKEIVYSSILSGVRDIYRHEGIKGFYSGFIPRVLAEMIGIAATQTLFSVLFKPCVTRSNIRFFFNNTTRNVARYLLYPLKLISVIMAVKPCDRLAASKLEPNFFSWISCWRYLNSTGQLRRGYQVIWRYQRHLSVEQFLSNYPDLPSISHPN